MPAKAFIPPNLVKHFAVMHEHFKMVDVVDLYDGVLNREVWMYLGESIDVLGAEIERQARSAHLDRTSDMLFRLRAWRDDARRLHEQIAGRFGWSEDGVAPRQAPRPKPPPLPAPAQVPSVRKPKEAIW